MLSGIIIGLQHDLREELDSLGKEIAFEGESEFGDFAFNLDSELPSDRVD